MFKKEIRVIGIDDSPFNKFNDSKVLVVSVVMPEAEPYEFDEL